MNSCLDPKELEIQFPEAIDTDTKLECIRILNLQWKEIERLEQELINKEHDLVRVENERDYLKNRVEDFGLKYVNTNGVLELYCANRGLLDAQTPNYKACFNNLVNVEDFMYQLKHTNYIIDKHRTKLDMMNKPLPKPSFYQKIQKLAYDILHPSLKRKI